MKSPWSKVPANNEVRAFEGGGMGDYYGSGVRNPIGKVRGGMNPPSESDTKKPIGNLA